MRFPRVFLAIAAATTLAPAARAQDSALVAAQQAQVRAMLEQIARDRPPQAENAARDLLRQFQIERAALDSLRQRSLAEYWAEVAQLTVQREMLMHQADSLRQKLMAQVFGAEARARALQRDYIQIRQNRGARPSVGNNQPIIVVDGVPVNEPADSGRVRAIREQLQTILERHFAAEDSLRSLEIADVERRLVQVRAETARRRRDRAELVRRMLEDVLRDAKPPE
jgi:hypothetical protein